jgi:cell wall-associated NlpC family hydrolase
MRNVLAALFVLFLPFAALAGERGDDVVFYALSLSDAPYSYGGTSPETGFDCSGFVGYVHDRTTGLKLPHNAEAIGQSAEPVSPESLTPGDMVFFNTDGRDYSHVGIYLGDNRFIHASSSATGRVMISDMLSPYWHDRFNGAGRLPSQVAE